MVSSILFLIFKGDNNQCLSLVNWYLATFKFVLFISRVGMLAETQFIYAISINHSIKVASYILAYSQEF